MKEQGCYVYYSPNGGVWPDKSTEPKPSPTENGILHDRQPFVWPEGAEKITREGYRLQTSQNFLNIVRFYTADGKGGGLDPENICNGFGYDCWPYNSEELTKGGHDANWFGKEGLGLSDGESVTLYICWDPIVNYHIGDICIRDFVYKTSGDDYRILCPGDKTNYALNRMDHNIEGYEGPFELPMAEIDHYVDSNGKIYTPGEVYTVTEPLELFAVFGK